MSTDKLLLSKIEENTRLVLAEFIAKTNLSPGDLVVVGCSTSEAVGGIIGTSSSVDAAEALWNIIYSTLSVAGLNLAVQCCEHLNRAVVIERSVAEQRGYEIVSAVPHPKAGGAFAATAYHELKDPVLVEFLKPVGAEAGLDIGDTLIGMHLRHVAVPIKFEQKNIGGAHISGAFYRPKYIGGERALYS